MPYGGVKDSGLGREGLRWAIEDMTEIRIMVLAQPGLTRPTRRRSTAGRSRRPAARDVMRRAADRVPHPWRDGPDPHPRPARAPGARPRVRARRPPAARGRVRAGRRARPARLGRTRSGRPPSRRGCTAGRFPSRSAGRAGRCSSRCSSTSSSASRPAACGRTSRAPTTSWSTRDAGAARGATSTRRCAASARGATRSPRTAPARTPATLRATAVRDAATGEYVLNGEKWFVTGPDDTDFMIFHCLVVDGDERRPTLFLVDYDTPGRASSSTTRTTPTPSPTAIPQFVLEDVRVPASAVLGGVGQADELTNEWFVEERIHIGARCSGAMERLLDARRRVGDRAGPVRGAHLRLPGGQLPAGRLGGRRVGGPAAHPGVRLAGRHRGRPQGRPRQGVAGQAVRVGGGLPLRRPGRPGLRRPRLHARVRRRSGSCASCGSTGSGRARRRSSG